MRRSALAALAAAAGIATVAAGCGGGNAGSPESQESAYAEAFAQSFQASFEDDDLTIGDDEARCVGDRVVEIVGVETLEDAGVTLDEVQAGESLAEVLPKPTQEQADLFVDGMFECLDFGGLVAQGLKTGAEKDGVEIEDAVAKFECVGENFERSEAFRAALAQNLLTGESTGLDSLGSDVDVILELIGDCLSLEDLLKIGQATDQ